MTGFFKKIGNILGVSKESIANWEHKVPNVSNFIERNLKTELIWKIPDLSNPKYDNIKKIDCFAVKDYECAVFLQKGEIIDILKGGVYELEKSAKIEGTEIILADTREIQLPFGIAMDSNLLRTADGFPLGLFCHLTLKIEDVKKFVIKITGNNIYTGENLRDSIRNIVDPALSDIIYSYNLSELASIPQNKFASEIVVIIYDQLMDKGIKIIGFGPVNFKYPEDAKSVLELTRRDIIRNTIRIDTIRELSNQDEIEKVKAEIEKRKIRRERELELERRGTAVAKMETQHLLQEKEIIHKLDIAETEVELTKKEALKSEIEAKSKAMGEYYQKKYPAQAELEIEKARKEIEVSLDISKLMAKTEAEISAIKAESEVFKLKRLAESQARIQESEANIDIVKLETEKELAKQPESKLVISNKYKYINQEIDKQTILIEIKKLKQIIDKYENELEKIRNEIMKIYHDLKDNKISENIYTTQFNFLKEEKNNLESKIKTLQSELKEKEKLIY
ncbi:MAG: SPFH domain-containing protein [Candidatus Helarchaeota archaeon]